jgi:hypothetical protein
VAASNCRADRHSLVRRSNHKRNAESGKDAPAGEATIPPRISNDACIAASPGHTFPDRSDLERFSLATVRRGAAARFSRRWRCGAEWPVKSFAAEFRHANCSYHLRMDRRESIGCIVVSMSVLPPIPVSLEQQIAMTPYGNSNLAVGGGPFRGIGFPDLDRKVPLRVSSHHAIKRRTGLRGTVTG